MNMEFCQSCGAGIGQHRREGEGTCPKCDPAIRALNTSDAYIERTIRDLLRKQRMDSSQIIAELLARDVTEKDANYVFNRLLADNRVRYDSYTTLYRLP